MKRISYIESTGTQYIDTGIKANAYTTVEIKLEILASGVQRLFGVSIDNQTFYIGQQSNANKLFFNFQKISTTYRLVSDIAGYNTGIHTLKIQNKEFFVDGVSAGVSSGTNFTSTNNALIFNTKGSSSPYAICRVYYCKIWDDGDLVRDFIPALDENNVACLFDAVTGQYFYNQGTGDFDIGEVIQDNLIYDRTQEDVDYALSNQNSELYLKGAYNYTDFYRIEDWCRYIAEQLNLYGYSVNITTKTNWSMSDFPTKTEMRRIRNNVQELKEAFIAFTNVPENMEKMTYQKANDLEKVLHELDTLINNMIASFYYSGTFYSGESEGLL